MRLSRASMLSAMTLTSQLGELEATERVLVRYSKGPQARKTASGQDIDHGNKPDCRSAIRRALAHCRPRAS